MKANLDWRWIVIERWRLFCTHQCVFQIRQIMTRNNTNSADWRWNFRLCTGIHSPGGLRLSEICGHSCICALMTVYYRGICWSLSNSCSTVTLTYYQCKCYHLLVPLSAPTSHFSWFPSQKLSEYEKLSHKLKLTLKGDASQHTPALLASTRLNLMAQPSFVFTQTCSGTASAKTRISTGSSLRCPSTWKLKKVRGTQLFSKLVVCLSDLVFSLWSLYQLSPS